MEVVGTVGAVIGIVDVVTRSILKLAEIRKKYKSVELVVELLSTQLGTVKVALGQIEEFLSSDLREDEQHYQLVMNIDIAIRSCDSLVRLIDKQLSALMYNNGNAILKRSKITLALNSKGMDECVTRLDRQVNGLNFLITTFQCNISSQQYSLLTSIKTQRIFEQLKDDSTSLVVLHDTASFQTKRTMTTTTTSKLSMDFTFDVELLQHKLYKSTLKSLMRRVGTGSGRAMGLVNQLAPSDVLPSTKTLLETDSLAALRKRKCFEVRVLAIVDDNQELLRTLQKIGGFIFEDKKRIRRERMIRWAMLEVISAVDECCRSCKNMRPRICDCTVNATLLRRDLDDLHSRPGYLLPENIRTARQLLSILDKDKFAARRQGEARVLALVHRFLEPKFDPTEEDIYTEEDIITLDKAHDEDHTFQHTSIYLAQFVMRFATFKRYSFSRFPRSYTFEGVECVILNLDLMEFDGLTDRASIQLKCDIYRGDLLRQFPTALSSISHALLLVKNKAPFARRLGSRHPSDPFLGSRGLQKATDLIAKTIIGRDVCHTVAEWNVDEDVDYKALHNTFVTTFDDLIISGNLQRFTGC